MARRYCTVPRASESKTLLINLNGTVRNVSSARSLFSSSAAIDGILIVSRHLIVILLITLELERKFQWQSLDGVLRSNHAACEIEHGNYQSSARVVKREKVACLSNLIRCLERHRQKVDHPATMACSRVLNETTAS